jgi:glutamine synthetase adenylyltransferase
MSVVIPTNAAETYQGEGAETWVEVSLTRAVVLT